MEPTFASVHLEKPENIAQRVGSYIEILHYLIVSKLSAVLISRFGRI